VYDVFTVAGGEQIFLAAVSDAQWLTFCEVLGYADLKTDPALATNNQRVKARATMMPALRERLAGRRADELAATMEAAGLPYAPIRRPEDLYDDPHLQATGGLAPIVLPDGERAGQTVGTTLLPFTLGGTRPGVRLDPPRVGQHTRETLAALGKTEAEIDAMQAAGYVA
jgi:crotonobetainyl-CoA:carnitine CoA-transferase CaiB-like acyl-CoA transferase